jgi:hypothetical protein
MTEGCAGLGSILRRMRMIRKSMARSKASASRAFASSSNRSRESTRRGLAAKTLSSPYSEEVSGYSLPSSSRNACASWSSHLVPNRTRAFSAVHASAQHRAHPGQELAKLARLGQIVVGAELKPHHPVNRARRGGEHDDRHAGAPLEVPDDRKTVLLRHVQIEDNQVGHLLGDRVAQAAAAIAQAHVKSVHAQIVAHHIARGLLVVDDHDVLHLAHATGKLMLKVAPLPGPALSTVIRPPCKSTMRLAIDSPSPVEVSPAVGLAESR